MSGGAESVKTVELLDGSVAVLDLFTESADEQGRPYFYFNAYTMKDDLFDIDKDLFTTRNYLKEDGDEPSDWMGAAIERFDAQVMKLNTAWASKNDMPAGSLSKPVKVRRSKVGHVAHTRSRPADPRRRRGAAAIDWGM